RGISQAATETDSIIGIYNSFI
ncbi:MAG: hypothetical protein RIQ29_250, partial [Pseudomonadota bacterium]